MILWKFGQASNPIQESEIEYFKADQFLPGKFYVCAKKSEDCFCPIGNTIRLIGMHYSRGLF